MGIPMTTVLPRTACTSGVCTFDVLKYSRDQYSALVAIYDFSRRTAAPSRLLRENFG